MSPMWWAPRYQRSKATARIRKVEPAVQSSRARGLLRLTRNAAPTAMQDATTPTMWPDG